MKKYIKYFTVFAVVMTATLALVSSYAQAEMLQPQSNNDCYVMVEPAEQKSIQGDAKNIPECYDSSALRSSSTVTGIDYDGQYYTGNSLTLTTPDPNGCNTGSSYKLNQMPSGWDNTVESAKGFGGCNSFFHYENTFQGGIYIECSPNCIFMNVMNNQTSSVRMAP